MIRLMSQMAEGKNEKSKNLTEWRVIKGRFKKKTRRKYKVWAEAKTGIRGDRSTGYFETKDERGQRDLNYCTTRQNALGKLTRELCIIIHNLI